MQEVKLVAEKRTERGSRACRKLRANGKIPGNLFGHKQDPVEFSADKTFVTNLVRSGNKLVDVTIGGQSEKALLREVQWDQLGDFIDHIDLQRVDPNEKLTMEIHVELRGTARGVLSGGVLDHELHTLTVECLVTNIPNSIVVKVAELDVGQSIHVREVTLPEGVKVLNNPDAIVVQVAAHVVAELPETGAGAAQPEVIGRKADEKKEDE